jgi:hypothetical protein
MNKISEHISWYEATNSAIAKKLNIANYPNEHELQNMEELARNIFEPVREHFDVPILVSSFYRSAELNEAIGGVDTSQHLAQDGAAMDLDADAYGKITNVEIFNYILNNLDFDQLILEDVTEKEAGWVHVSYNKYNNRNEVLLMFRTNGTTSYRHYSERALNKLMGK